MAKLQPADAKSDFASDADESAYQTSAVLHHLAPPQQPGEMGQFGKYRILKLLGQGGMGAVYLAFDERLQRKIALKVMLPHVAANKLSRVRFLREARSAAQVNCDHVVSIYEADEYNEVPYISLQ